MSGVFSRTNITVTMALMMAAGLTIVMGMSLSHVNRLPGATDQPSQGRFSNVSARHAITGFQYQAHREGHTALTVTADRFSIRKKKLGFLSIGLMDEARFENAVIRIYEHAPSDAYGNGMATGVETEGLKSLFVDIRDRKAFPLMGKKKITSLVFSPILVEFFAGDEQTLSVLAGSAVFKARGSKVVFSGNVRFVSKGKERTTDQLSFDLKTHRFVTG